MQVRTTWTVHVPCMCMRVRIRTPRRMQGRRKTHKGWILDATSHNQTTRNITQPNQTQHHTTKPDATSHNQTKCNITQPNQTQHHTTKLRYLQKHQKNKKCHKSTITWTWKYFWGIRALRFCSTSSCSRWAGVCACVKESLGQKRGQVKESVRWARGRHAPLGLPLRLAQSFLPFFWNMSRERCNSINLILSFLSERQEKIHVVSCLLPFSFPFSYDLFCFLSLEGGRLNILMLPAIFCSKKIGEKGEKTYIYI